ncbi:MAG TPA: class I SAM-dependent methyltransferase [Roseiflexaceae bacterium]|nr:class I SAM-dependent methyltransferase [Roseiflexaceae bacterium]
MLPCHPAQAGIQQRYIESRKPMNNNDSLASHTAAVHRLVNAAFIDAHYAVCRTMYEAMLRAVGIQPGWHVLDAGCGSGSFLPLIAELVGPGGAITAFDLDPENVARVEALRARLDVPVDVQIGNATNLPYPDNTFDAIWSANVIQYLKGDELAQMLHECVRVVKPGGIVAIKESDTTILQGYPLESPAASDY